MSNKDELEKLNRLKAPMPSKAARAAAMTAAMEAFDAAEAEKTTTSTQGFALGNRLKAIFDLERIFKMDIRVPITAAAAGLLLMPLAMQLNSTTGLVPPADINLPFSTTEPAIVDLEDDAAIETRTQAKSEMTAAQDGDSAETAPSPVPEPVMEAEMAEEQFSDLAASAEAPAAPAPTTQILSRKLQAVTGAQNSAIVSGDEAAFAPLRDRIAVPEMPAGDRFEAFSDQTQVSVADQPLSTFSVDVDTASYAYVRRALETGVLPPRDAVRVEEMINYFDYNYPAPESAETPFSITTGVFPTPWNANTRLMHIGISGYTPPQLADQPANLVFLIDTSGSMNDADKLPLLKRSFALLLDQLRPEDTVSIVTYAGSAGVVLEPTEVSDRRTILDAITTLQPGGSTAGAAGIETAYRLAARNFDEDGVNRVILATDGDFNVGISDPETLKSFIEDKRDDGISLSVLGFGQGNLNDALMQALAQNGNGNAYYIDSYREARKVLAEDVAGTLVTIAKDVKIQVEFNPATVSSYRQIGYESRALRAEDFNNDRVDAGDIGSGHTVTALYEFVPAGMSDGLIDPSRYSEAEPVASPEPGEEYAYIKLRYKLPDGDVSRLVEQPVTVGSVFDATAMAGNDQRFAAAVAALGQKLRGSTAVDGISYADIAALAEGALGVDAHGYRAEFLDLVGLARTISGEGVCAHSGVDVDCR